MSYRQHPQLCLDAVTLHMSELQAQADRDRLARLARGAHPLRRQFGRLLVRAGRALQGAPALALDGDDGACYEPRVA